jgi:isopenicillin N synthase-like dioxygenase
MTSLPIIDFEPFRTGDDNEKLQVAKQVDLACKNFGFFMLSGHGLNQTMLDKTFRAAKTFFDLPVEQKEKISIDQSPVHRGWYRLGEEVLDQTENPQGDFKEGVKIGNECGPEHPRVLAGTALHGSNQWPNIDGWQTTMEACYDACSTLSRQLMQAFAIGLNLDAEFFDKWLTEPMATLSPIYYPPQPPGQLSAGAHTDFGCLTLLIQSKVAGLEVFSKPSGWIAVPVMEDHIVINIGDMMARWTNDCYPSTLHRVRNRSGLERQSLAFFFDPDPNADLSPLPGCLENDQTPHYSQATCVEHLVEKINQSFDYRRDEPSHSSEFEETL